jgi:hypothetical protein
MWNYNYPPVEPLFNPVKSGITVFNRRAMPLFERARWLARLHGLFARLLHRSRKLLVLDTIEIIEPHNKARAGNLQSVPIKRIRGSVNQSDDYDRDFYPLHDRLADRWVRIASMMIQGTPLPPVELVQVGDSYFVVDGHHRVSVSRMLNYEVVDAVVTAVYG